MGEFEFDLGGFEEDLKATLQKSGDAFRGKYKDELNKLAGLSRSEIDAITPDGTDLAVYDALIEVVKDASRKNLSQAELKTRIVKLGDIAIRIARKVPALASFV